MARFTRVVSLLLVLLALSLNSSAQTTELTYQGQLQSSSAMASGVYDFEFALFDGGGAQVGPVLTRTGVNVTNGIFSVNLDFGSSFPGASRFLEIRVRPAGGGSFTTLTPRQPLTSAPYSVKSINAENAFNATNAQNAANAVNATNALNAAALGGLAPSGFIQNTTSTQASSNFNISGNGTVGGTLSGGIVSAQDWFSIGGNKILSMGSNNLIAGLLAGANNSAINNAFFGAFAGEQNVTGVSNSFFGTSAGRQTTSGSFNSFFGRTTGQGNTTGSRNTFIGHQAGNGNLGGSDNTFIGEKAGDTNSIGNSNTVIGAQADLVSPGLSFATAIGAGAIASGSNQIHLGRGSGNDVVAAPGVMVVGFAGGTDAEPAGGGHLIVGQPSSLNIAIDNNEIMARNSGSIATLSLNADGGNVNLIQSGTGNVGIGTSAPALKLHVAGHAGKTEGGSSWVVISDMRLKNSITPFTAGLNAIRKLNPIKFKYRTDNPLGLTSQNDNVGFSAQEVQKVLPEAVSTNASGYLQLSSDPIFWTMLNAIKEQQGQIESLRKVNSAQQNQINELKQIVCSGNKRVGRCKVRSKN